MATAKVLRQSIDYVLYEMSFANLSMYNRVVPSYTKPDKDGKKTKQHKRINGDDPRSQEKINKELEELG